MANSFDYDWFTGPAFQQQKEAARIRCALKKFPDKSPEELRDNAEFKKVMDELEVRALIYLRDGFSYEMKELIDLGLKGLLSFECEPVDDQYKVGSFIVSTVYDEVIRVEVFAVHPSEKPEDTPIITGFRNRPLDGKEPAPGREARDGYDYPEGYEE